MKLFRGVKVQIFIQWLILKQSEEIKPIPTGLLLQIGIDPSLAPQIRWMVIKQKL